MPHMSRVAAQMPRSAAGGGAFRRLLYTLLALVRGAARNLRVQIWRVLT